MAEGSIALFHYKKQIKKLVELKKFISVLKSPLGDLGAKGMQRIYNFPRFFSLGLT